MSGSDTINKLFEKIESTDLSYTTVIMGVTPSNGAQIIGAKVFDDITFGNDVKSEINKSKDDHDYQIAGLTQAYITQNLSEPFIIIQVFTMSGGPWATHTIDSYRLMWTASSGIQAAHPKKR